MLRKSVSFCVRTIQGLPVYRRIAGSLVSRIEIRQADEEKLKFVHDWLSPGGEAFASPGPRVTSFVAKKGARTIGSVVLRRSEIGTLFPGYWLFGLVVRSVYRGMGVGGRLTRVVIKKAREEGAEGVYLLVYEDNRRAMELYRKLGFEVKLMPALEAQLAREKLSSGRRRVVMRKSLA